MDYAIIGDYASDKLLITEFNIERNNDKQVTATKSRKVVGSSKQSVSISMSGYLRCTSFADLETEIDRLQAALNKPEFKLVLGAKPHVYWNVTWSSADFPRTPKNGGYVLPVSFDFEALEEAAVGGLACGLGWVAGVIPVTHQGDHAADGLTHDNVGSVFTKLVIPNGSNNLYVMTNHTLAVYKDANVTNLNFYVGGVLKYQQTVPQRDGQVIIGMVYGINTLTLYYDGIPYTFNAGEVRPTYVVSSNRFSYKLWDAVMPFPAPALYVANAVMKDVPVIRVYQLVAGGNLVTYSGTAKGKVSLITTGGSSSFTTNDFGCSVNDSASTYYTFNSLTDEIKTTTASSVAGISYYTGKKTLFPYFVVGLNNVSKVGSTFAVVSWHERFY